MLEDYTAFINERVITTKSEISDIIQDIFNTHTYNHFAGIKQP